MIPKIKSRPSARNICKLLCQPKQLQLRRPRLGRSAIPTSSTPASGQRWILQRRASARGRSGCRIRPGANVDRYSIASYLGGSAMLTVLYANGEGVLPHNIPLARRFACEAEIGHGLKDIEAISSSPIQTRRKFKFCDEAYSTPEMNLCMTFDSEVAAQKRGDALAKLSSRWPKAHKAAFKSLEQAMETFAEAHGQGETDMGGTIRTMRAIGVMERVRDKFLAAL